MVMIKLRNEPKKITDDFQIIHRLAPGFCGSEMLIKLKQTTSQDVWDAEETKTNLKSIFSLPLAFVERTVAEIENVAYRKKGIFTSFF